MKAFVRIKLVLGTTGITDTVNYSVERGNNSNIWQNMLKFVYTLFITEQSDSCMVFKCKMLKCNEFIGILLVFAFATIILNSS